MTNLFTPPAGPLSAEFFETLARSPHCRIERIVSHGQASPPDFWYDQTEAEWVAVLAGAARIRFADETVDLQPGDTLYIAPHRKHRVEWTTPDAATIWLAVFYSE